MALWVVDEAVRNAVAVGGDPDRMAILDNFCWGDPRKPEVLGDLVEACRGCYDAAKFFRTPFISGKDSLFNEYRGQSIPPTLLISALCLHPDVQRAPGADLKSAGNAVFLLGTPQGEPIRRELPSWAPELYRRVHRAIHEGLIVSAHDASEGGLAVAAAEMAIGGRLGLELALDDLHAERPCRLLVETARAERLQRLFEGLPCTELGRVLEEPVLRLGAQSWTIDQLLEAWKS
jgi:phosphoribosylformylglycinamidine synthase